MMASEQTTRELVERYVAALPSDFDALARLRHADFVEEWPQSGERIRGHENYRAIHETYPGGMPTASDPSIRSTEDTWVLTPLFTPLRIAGSGNTYFIELRLHYPGGDSAHAIAIVEVRDGKVARQTTYFAAPFEAPAWRAPLVEKM